MTALADFDEFNRGVERARAAYLGGARAAVRPVCASAGCQRRTAHASGQCLHCRRNKIPAATPRRSTTTQGATA